ncbi:MAG: esterase/lipase family protein [Sphingobacteriales bacterium]
MFKITRITAPSSIGEDKSDSAVLFVHGLGGSYNTWYPFANHLKNKWREIDSFGLEYDQYYSSQGFINRIPYIRGIPNLRKILVGPNIDTLSQHFKTTVNTLCEEYDNVIIVAHSMGGLVARKYLVNLLKETKTVGKVKALITYATPHHGSVYANYYLILCYGFLGLFISNSKQITDLSKNNEFINSLNLDWSNLRIDDKIDFRRVVGLDDWLVDEDSSAYKNDPNVEKVAGKNHFTLIIPDERRNKDNAFMFTYNYLKNFKKNLDSASESTFDYEEYDFDNPTD